MGHADLDRSLAVVRGGHRILVMRFHLPALDHGVMYPADPGQRHLGALAEIEALSLGLLEVRQLEPHANHRNQVRATHHDDR
jgi:hypothetical protein